MHSRLEGYLSEVAARLGPLPAKARDEELREMRAHLEAAFAAGLERGQSEDEAARGVLAQFGTPDAVGTETVAAWRRGVALNRRSFWGAAACALAVMFLMGLLLARLDSAAPEGLRVSNLGYSLAGPILAGAMCGLLFSKRAIAGAGLGAALYYVFGIGLWIYWVSQPSHLRLLTHPIPLEFLLFSIQFIQHSLIILLSVWAVSRWRSARTGRGRAARV